MYIPSSNAEPRRDVLFGFVEAHPLGALGTAGAEGLLATRLPFVLDRSRGEWGVLQGHLARANPHHRDREHPWAVGDAPAEYVERLERAVVGVEIEITRLEGKWKMSQNRSPEDVEGVVRGLSASADPRGRAVARIVDSSRPGDR